MDKFSLSVEPGSFTVVLGAPGSGKSTLLQHLNGLLQPMEGSVASGGAILRGEATHEADGSGKGRKKTRAEHKRLTESLMDMRRRTGLVFQFPEKQLFEETVLQDIAFGPLNFGQSAEEADASARRAAYEVELDEELLNRSPFQLSGGQMRKAAIASVLAPEPEIIALDEPTASLDQHSREELLQLLRDLCRFEGKTVLIVTHRLEEVLPYGDRFVVINKGRKAFYGTAAELLSNRDVLADAGIAVPASVSLLETLAGGINAPAPIGALTPQLAAQWIKNVWLAAREEG